MKSCDVTRDLLPLYMDDSCSEDSREFVDAHLAECEACRAVHNAASKTVQTVLSGKKVKKSFRKFRRKARMKKMLLILLCTLISLIMLTAVLYRPLENYLSGHLPARTVPFVAEVSRLSDGGIYLSLRYTKEDVYVNSTIIDPHPLEPQTLCIELGYNRLNSWDFRLINNGSWHTFYVPTGESAVLYETSPSSYHWFSWPYNKIVLIGSDGERVLWQEGDDIPAADEQEERYLQKLIDDGFLIPVSGQP